MGATPEFGSTPHQAAYYQLLQLSLQGDAAGLQTYVEPDAFAAYLPDQGRLDLDQYLRFMASLREASPDFGREVTMLHYVEQGDTLAVLYRMVFTMLGRRIEYTSSDWIFFGTDGRVTELRVYYDRGDTRDQLAGRPIFIE